MSFEFYLEYDLKSLCNLCFKYATEGYRVAGRGLVMLCLDDSFPKGEFKPDLTYVPLDIKIIERQNNLGFGEARKVIKNLLDTYGSEEIVKKYNPLTQGVLLLSAGDDYCKSVNQGLIELRKNGDSSALKIEEIEPSQEMRLFSRNRFLSPRPQSSRTEPMPM